MVSENIQNIQNRIVSACVRVSRKPEEIKIVAVTKTFGSDSIREAVKADIFDIGENYVQELSRKHDEVNDSRIRWHYIGHLQTNKVKYIVDWIHLIHAVDSLRLGEEISKWAVKIGRTIDVLVEVNTTGETSKFGVQPSDVFDLVINLKKLSSINVSGLMTMGQMSDNPEESRTSFKMLKGIKKSLEQNNYVLPHLSMGMSNDFEVAIEEGATIIRLGTAIFGVRTSKN